MEILDLPLEIFELILAECMRARSYERMLRLRLVSKFFSQEVLVVIFKHRMLEDNLKEKCISHYGDIGTQYLRKCMLSGKWLTRRLEHLCNVARDFAAEEGDNPDKTFENYIDILSTMAARECHYPFDSHNARRYEAYEIKNGILEYDLACAAAATGRLDVVRECTEDPINTEITCGTLGDTFRSAVMGGNLDIIDHLFHKAEEYGQGVGARWWRMLIHASGLGKVDIAKHLLSLPSKWKPLLEKGLLELNSLDRHTGHLHNLDKALITPSPIIFDMLIPYAKGMSLTAEHAAALLENATRKGWSEMCRHLLDLGAPMDIKPYVRRCKRYACPGLEPNRLYEGFRGQDMSLSIIEMLLDRGVEPHAFSIFEIARRGQISSVKLLVKRGAAPKGTSMLERLLFISLRLEQEGLFRWLIERGAVMRARAAKDAKEEMKVKGLESMGKLLAEAVVVVEDALLPVDSDYDCYCD